MLPNFVVIGAGKAGTTSIYHWLRGHPDVFMPARIKETFFFSYNPDNPDYSQLAGAPDFPVKSVTEYEQLFDEAGDATAVGEATPNYLDSPVAPQRLRSLIPHAKLIVSLRDPVDRVVSHAQMNVRLGLAEDLEDDIRRMADTDEHEYAPKLERWFTAMPREQFLVINFDDLATDPLLTARQMFRFLGVADSHEPPTDTIFNPGGVPRSRFVQRILEMRALRALRPIVPASGFALAARIRGWNAKPPAPLSPALAASLRDRYRDDVEKTAAITKLDLSTWSTVAADETFDERS